MTSLAAQLNRLKAPQTSLLLQKNRKPSLLFDPKEAAELDRRTVYNLGKQGLQELIELNKRFTKFEDTLFSENSINFERSVRTSSENEKIDSAISEFLVFVSPYFLISSTHKALEWLIHRFHIQDFDKDSLLMLILPYHESRMFVRALQLMDFNLPSDKWHWLQPLQKCRKPLGFLVFLKQLRTDNGLLKMISEYVVFATKIYSTEANSLSVVYSFYTQSVVGWLHGSPHIENTQINYILPTLTKGLSSEIVNFSAGCYMILAKLILLVKLVEKDANIILQKITKNPVLKSDATMMIIFMYTNHKNRVETMSEKLMLRLVESSWFAECLPKIKQMGLKTEQFMQIFFGKAFAYLVNNKCDKLMDTDEENPLQKRVEKVQSFMMKVIDEIPLDVEEVNAILKMAVENDLSSMGESQDFFIKMFTTLETRYSNIFDDYLKKLISVDGEDVKEEAGRAFKFLTTWHSDWRNADITLDIIIKLNHFSSMQRIAALNLLANSKVVINERLKTTLLNSLLARFEDEDPEVVKALLSIPTGRLKQLASTELTDKLLNLLSTCHMRSRKVLAGPALNILLNVHRCEDDVMVFLTALPFLFPCSEKEVDKALQILKSKYASNNPYLSAVKKDTQNQPTADNIRSVAFHYLLDRSLLPETKSLLACIEELSSGDAATIFFNLLVLGSICRVRVGCLQIDEACKSIELIAKMMNFPRIKYLKNMTQMNSEKLLDALHSTEEDVLPLQAATYVLEMIHRRLNISSNSTIDFIKSPERSQLILKMMEIYLDGMMKKRQNEHYRWCLKIFFQRHFTSIKDLLRFLSRFFIKPVKTYISIHCLQITLTLLEKCNKIQWIFEDNIFVPHLLLAIASEEKNCREYAIKILKKLVMTFNLTVDGFFTFLQELFKREAEIYLDADQLSLALYMLLSPDPDVSCQYKANVRVKLEYAREKLFEIVKDESMPINIVSQLLRLLAHVNSPKILKELIPLGQKFLHSHENEYAKSSLEYLLLRFNNNTTETLKDKEVWEFFEKSMNKHDIIIDENKKGSMTPSMIIMKQIDETFFERLNKKSPEIARTVFKKLIEIVTYCDVSNVVLTANRVIRQIHIDAQIVVNELMKMIMVKNTIQQKSCPTGKNRRHVYVPTSPEIINTTEWKCGQTILEFIQDANNIDNVDILVPVLLDLLKLCLSFEDQNPLEYTNQLVLSTLYHLAMKKVKSLIKDSHLHIGLIAQCIRTSHNPQTHHHALLLLVELFKMADIQSALHQVMQIFTFMGNSVLRQDDAYSIQIISKTIETIVPIVTNTNNEKHLADLFRIFVTTFPDMPEHRRQPLFSKLLHLMQNHLHLYFLVSLESHIKSPQVVNDNVINLKLPAEKLDFALQMSQEFEPKDIINVCANLLDFLLKLPVSLEINENQQKQFKYSHVFDLTTVSLRELRHMKYISTQFLVSLLSTPEFISKVLQLPYEESLKRREQYDKLIVSLVLLIRNTSKMAQPGSHQKYWRALLHYEYEALECVNNLLPNPVFLETLKYLSCHEIPVVRRKALEMLNTRLFKKVFSEDEYNELLKLIDPLMEIIKEPIKSKNQDLEVIQQLALISLKYLAKLLAFKQQNVFIPVLNLTTELLRIREGSVLASSVLCMAELCSCIGPYAVQSLNRIIPEMLWLLDTYCCQKTPDMVIVSIVSSLQKIVEAVGNFISKDDLDKLLMKLCKLMSFYSNIKHAKAEIIMTRVKTTAQKLANSISLRILLPAIDRTYNNIMREKDYHFICPLMEILTESFNTIQTSDLNNLVFNSKEQDLTTFFLKVFEFRERMVANEEDISLKDIDAVEHSASKALIALTVKLSETTFRPLYYKFYDWAARNPDIQSRNITFYKISANIAECLKSLFVLFAGHFIKHAADLLAENHISNQKSKDDKPRYNDSDSVELTEAILLTLMRTFEYDAHDFVNQERFNTLMTHLVDQLENTLGGQESYEKRAQELIVPCIGAFANAISDDSLHNQLVYHVILKSNHVKLHIRIAVLNTLVEIARKLGKDFMPLLSEIIPVLSEMQEDEEMETNVRNAIWALEDILEQPLNKYL